MKCTAVQRIAALYTPLDTVLKGTGTTISYTDNDKGAGLTTGKTYYYKIRAYDGTKHSSYSSYKYAKPVPSAPADIAAERTSAISINVSWDAVEGAAGTRCTGQRP